MSGATTEMSRQVISKQSQVRKLLKKVEPANFKERPKELAWNKGWNLFNKPRGG